MGNTINHFFGILILSALLSACGSTSNETSTENKVAGKEPAEWHTGVGLYSFNKYSFAESLDKADSAGVEYVEGFSFHNMGKEFNDSLLSSLTPEQISMMKAMLDKKGLKMSSLYVGDANSVNQWKYYLQIAKDLGMKNVVCEPRKDQWDMIDSLAGAYGLKVAIHEHMKGKSLYWHPDSVLAAIKGHPNFGACADVGHWVRSGLDPVKCLQQLNGHIIELHLKDLDASGKEDANDVNVGTGVIKFADVVEELRKQNFKGIVYVECEHKMEYNLPEVVEAVRYFNDLSKK
jgi:sugar phosphate isomerase/epimerase